MKFKSPIKMPFGKYKGQAIEDLPDNYLRWCIENLQDPVLVKEMENQINLRIGQGIVRKQAKSKFYWIIDKSVSPTNIYGPYNSNEECASAIINMGLKDASVVDTQD